MTLAAIDAAIVAYEDSLKDIEVLTARRDVLKDQLVKMVEQHGAVPANAKSMKRLKGAKRSATLTYSSSTTVLADGVRELEALLVAKKVGGLFARFFVKQDPPVYVPPPPSYRRVASPDVVFASGAAKVGTQLRAKIFELYGRCVTTTPNKPSLKVEADKSSGETKHG